MSIDECFYLGKITKKYSFKGEVVMYLDTDEPHLYKKMESVFMSYGNKLVPFFIEKSSLHKSTQLRVKFKDINTEAEAESIVGCEIYLPLTLLPKLSGTKFYFHEVIGFQVIDENLGEIGVIKSINDSTSQSLFEIDFNGKEILVPLIDQFIVKLDRESKSIYLNTPEGLVDIYLAD